MSAQVARFALATNDRIVVVAPHPDDDVLGCGALLSSAASAGVPIAVAYVTDGVRSHPHSKRYPAPRLRATREREALAALARFGIPASAATFLRLPDGGCEALGPAARSAARERIYRTLAAGAPTIVFAPWRRDPHPDHRAITQLVREARARMRARCQAPPTPPRLLEYPIWLAERGDASDGPRAGEAREYVFAFDRATAERKRDAVAAHRSQTTDLIDDDPSGFRLAPEMLARACRSPERFFEVIDD